MRHANRSDLVVLACLWFVSRPIRHATSELPPEIQADRFLVRAVRLEAEKDYVGALKALDDFLALQTAHNLTLPDDFHFKVARLAFSTGIISRAYDATTLYMTATGRTPPYDGGWGRGRRPVINVSWHDAVAYTRWLSLNTGRTYRLPSEWEWEYAAFGVITGDHYDADANAIAWYKGNSNGRTHPVGGKAPNAYDLYDMLGNAWEFAQDC